MYDLSTANPTVPVVTLANPIPTGADLFEGQPPSRSGTIWLSWEPTMPTCPVPSMRARLRLRSRQPHTHPSAVESGESHSGLQSRLWRFRGPSVEKRVIVGEPFATIGGMAYAGAAHVFDLSVSEYHHLHHDPQESDPGV